MDLSIHQQILLWVFLVAIVMGAVANKTSFCTMGAVSDWVNMGDTGRLRAWLLAITVAILGVVAMEAGGVVSLPGDTFPPYRTNNFAWLRYILGGVMFGIGMTLGSGCGNKTFVRIGGGNLKSLVLLVFFAAPAAYLMLWTDFFNTAFMSWIQPTIVDLSKFNITSQELGAIIGGLTGVADTARLHIILGLALGLGLLVFVFKSKDFRASFDNILGGLVIGAAVVIGWWITAGSMGTAWKEYADFAPEQISRIAAQSYTFVSPMGDSVRYLLTPTRLNNINFGIMALSGVVFGSFLYALFSRTFRFEWFASFKDFVSHAVGGVLMGVGGVLSMGCTIGQGVTGVSTLALGSFLAFGAIIFGSALTMKIQYYMLDEKGFFDALYHGLSDMRLLPKPRAA